MSCNNEKPCSMTFLLIIALILCVTHQFSTADNTPSEGMINVTKYAASGNGSSDSPWVDALRNAIAANGGRTTYYMPGGIYKDESTLVITADNVRIVGDGGEGSCVTTIKYDQTDGSSCWKFMKAPDSRFKYIAGITVQSVNFHGGDKATGAAVEIEALRRGLFEDICVWSFDGDKKTHAAKGFWIKGWDSITFRKIRCHRVTKCIYIDKNPNYDSIDADHFHFEDMILAPIDNEHGVGIEIVAPHATNLAFDGNTNIAKASKAIYLHNAGKGRARSLNLTFENIRVEQGDFSDDAWGVYLDGNYVSNVILSNIRVSAGYNGFYAHGMQNMTIMNTYAIGGPGFKDSGYRAYDIDMDAKTPLVMINADCNTIPQHGYREDTTVKIADELLLRAGDGYQVYQDGGAVFIKGVTDKE